MPVKRDIFRRSGRIHGRFWRAAIHMAKGNDGNYLQHCVETQAATQLLDIGATQRLHVAITHGMKPFESFDNPKGHVKNELLCSALERSGCSPRPDEPVLVTAYRQAGASAERYPNTAELLRTIVGRNQLYGGITETDSRKFNALECAWVDSSVTPVCNSWRLELSSGGVLACPDRLDIPWLFTMDPMTYVERGAGDDDKLHRNDLGKLSETLVRYFGTGQPGVAALFVYSVGSQGDNPQCQFWNFVQDLAVRIKKGLTTPHDVFVAQLWLPHNGGNRNLAGLLHTGIDLSSVLERSKINQLNHRAP